MKIKTLIILFFSLFLNEAFSLQNAMPTSDFQSVVRLRAIGGGEGSGFFISDSLLLTASHGCPNPEDCEFEIIEGAARKQRSALVIASENRWMLDAALVVFPPRTSQHFETLYERLPNPRPGSDVTLAVAGRVGYSKVEATTGVAQGTDEQPEVPAIFEIPVANAFGDMAIPEPGDSGSPLFAGGKSFQGVRRVLGMYIGKTAGRREAIYLNLTHRRFTNFIKQAMTLGKGKLAGRPIPGERERRPRERAPERIRECDDSKDTACSEIYTERSETLPLESCLANQRRYKTDYACYRKYENYGGYPTWMCFGCFK